MGLGTESWSEDWDASMAERHEGLTRAGPRNKRAELLNTRLSGIVGPNQAFQGTLHSE